VVEHVAGQALEHDLEDLPVDLLGLQVWRSKKAIS